MHRTTFLLLLLSAFSLITTSGLAQKAKKERKDYALKKGFYGGIETGSGWIQTSKNDLTDSRNATFILGIYGGYCPFRALRAGIKLDGYSIEPGNYNNPEKGIGISNIHLQVQVFPFKELPVFANVQGGRCKYENHHPYESNAKGYSQKIGLGYEYDLNQHFALSLMTNYSFGKFKDVYDITFTYPDYHYVDHHYDSWDLTLCVIYH